MAVPTTIGAAEFDPMAATHAINSCMADLEKDLELINAASQRLKSGLRQLTTGGAGALPELLKKGSRVSVWDRSDVISDGWQLQVASTRHSNISSVSEEQKSARPIAPALDMHQTNSLPLVAVHKTSLQIPSALEQYIQKHSMKPSRADHRKQSESNKSHMSYKSHFYANIRRQKVKLYGFWQEAHTNVSGNEKADVRAVITKRAFGSLESQQKVRRSLLGYGYSSGYNELSLQSILGMREKVWYGLKFPQSYFHIIWAIFGVCLLLGDGVAVPILIAWPHLSSHPFAQIQLFLGSIYWPLDIFLNCITGFYKKGLLIMSTSAAICNYAKTWMLADAALSTIDVLMVLTALQLMPSDNGDSTSKIFSAMKTLRFFRLFRLARLAKVSSISGMLKDVILTKFGHQFVELALMLVQSVFQLVLAIHILACLWFYVGDVRDDVDCENKDAECGWINYYEVRDDPGIEQYVLCFHYVVAQFTPAPISLQARTFSERCFTVFVVLFLLITVGTKISRISFFISQVLALSAENASKRRSVQHHLRVSKIHVGLSARILRFVDHKLSKQKEAVFDRSLISDKLVKEMIVVSRDYLLRGNSFFDVIREVFNPTFVEICGALSMEIFEKGDEVFRVGTISEGMVAVVPGPYTLHHGNTQEAVNYERPVHFAELSLFGSFLHTLTLVCDAYEDAFLLRAEDLASCTKGDLACCGFIYQFARQLLKEVTGGSSFYTDDRLAEVSRAAACKKTDCYQILNMPDSDMVENFKVDGEFEPPELATVQELVDKVSRGEIGSFEILDYLESHYAELFPETGSHARFSLPDERKRAIAAMVSVLYLLADRYEDFTQEQPESSRLSPESWEVLQAFVEWSGIKTSPRSIQVILVFLAIKGIGKAERVVLQLPPTHQDPENALLYIMRMLNNVVPSAYALEEDARKLLSQVISIHKEFNLGQFLQAENSPLSVYRLQRKLEEQDGVDTVKASLVAAFGLMCGLQGADGKQAWRGSKFMDENNSLGILTGLRSLQQIEERSCQEVYWSYVTKHADLFGMHLVTEADCAFARLLCLSRVKSKAAFEKLRITWNSLEHSQRLSLQDLFLGDGMNSLGLCFLYLPQCLANAKTNQSVGMLAMLELLVDLTDIVRTRLSLSLDFSDGPAVPRTVNLADLAAFTLEVKSKFIFFSSVDHVHLVQRADVQHDLQMTSTNWTRVDDEDSGMTSTSGSLRSIHRTLFTMQRAKEEKRHRYSASALAHCGQPGQPISPDWRTSNSSTAQPGELRHHFSDFEEEEYEL
eukprot:TRINITY_DN73228_c0_g1_i1.p1 TRINITY_DN73228_c0_g1~~TRINITY_DN73228_c0_g1_i1.p1  ORF type:complete len:1286 (-),score=224.23 TRINITY_DN73228_c0_g1_i1:69-3902(-)